MDIVRSEGAEDWLTTYNSRKALQNFFNGLGRFACNFLNFLKGNQCNQIHWIAACQVDFREAPCQYVLWLCGTVKCVYYSCVTDSIYYHRDYLLSSGLFTVTNVMKSFQCHMSHDHVMSQGLFNVKWSRNVMKSFQCHMSHDHVMSQGLSNVTWSRNVMKSFQCHMSHDHVMSQGLFNFTWSRNVTRAFDVRGSFQFHIIT